MVRNITTLLSIALVCCALPVQAQVASYDGAAMAPQQKPLAGYDNGFVLRSANDDFNLKLYSRIQVQHFYENYRTNTAGTGPDVNTFRLRRARFYFLGKLFKNWEFSTWVSHGTGAAAPSQLFWWADATAHVVPEFNVTFGATSMPMDRLGETSSGKMAFVEAPITVTQVDSAQTTSIARQAFGNPATLGLRLWGDIGKFHYALGVGNAGGDHRVFNTSKQFVYGTRVWVDVVGDPGYDESDFAYSETPGFAIGAGTAWDGVNAADTTINFVTLDSSWTSSGDMMLKWKGLTLLAEAYYRRLKTVTAGLSLTDFGYHSQIGYFVMPKKLEFVGRAAQMYREGPLNNSYEFAGGLNWYIHNQNIRFQLDYSNLRDYSLVGSGGTGGQRTHRVRSMLTLQI
jgi:hypothetical protein